MNRDAIAELCAKPLLPGMTVFLKGPNGTGKTLLGNILLQNQILVHGKTGLFMRATRYLAALLPEGATPVEQRALRKLVRDVDVLMFDDLGAEKRSVFSRRELVDLFDDRWGAERPTIITSNENLADVLGVTGDEPPKGGEEAELYAHGRRIISRLGERHARIDWPDETPDFRGEKNRGENEERKSAYRHSRDVAFDDSDRVAADRHKDRFGVAKTEEEF